MRGPVEARNYGCRLNIDGRLRGLRTAILENELLRVGVLADKGSEIFEFLYKPLDVDFMYLAPRGVQNPCHDTPSIGSGNGSFLDYYSGGWQEIFPNGGPACTHNGAEYGQHGEVALVPWSIAVSRDTPDEVSVDFWVQARRTPCTIHKRLTLRRGLPVLFIAERLTNHGAEPVQFMWGHHVAFGAPFLAAGCTIDAPAGRLIVEGEEPGFGPRLYRPGSESKWPAASAPGDGLGEGAPTDSTGAGADRVAADVVPSVDPARGAEEMAYLADLAAGWYAIANPKLGAGFALAWDPAVFRYVWYWQELYGGRAYPWYGRAYTVALEPWSSLGTHGLANAVRNGTHLELAAGATLETHLAASAFRAAGRVRHVWRDGEVTLAR